MPLREHQVYREGAADLPSFLLLPHVPDIVRRPDRRLGELPARLHRLERLWRHAQPVAVIGRSATRVLSGIRRTVCALDDGSDTIALTIALLDDPSSIVPDEQHSYRDSRPTWWTVTVEGKPVR